MSKISERLKTMRLNKGYTLAELAELLGVKEATVQRYESGEIKNLKHDTVVKLAEILKCSPSYLMGWEDHITTLDTKDKPFNLNLKEHQILSIFKKLNEDKQNKVIDYATAQFTDQEGESFIARNAAFGGASSTAVHTKESLTQLVSAINKEKSKME